MLAWLLPLLLVVGAVVVGDLLERRSISVEPSAEVTVGSRVDDLRTAVRAVVDLGERPETRSSVSGVVTAVAAEVGETLSQGSPIAVVNYVAVLALVGESPLVRDLQRGDSGPDVAVLGSFLRDLGHLSSENVTSQFGSAMRRAVQAFQASLGVPTDGVFRLSYVAFVSSGFGSISESPLVVGQSISAGDALVLGQPSVASLRFETVSEGRSLAPFVDQATVLSTATAELPIDSAVPSAETMPAIAAWVSENASLAESVGESSESEVRFDQLFLSLASPMSFGTVPSSAVLVPAEDTYCVVEVRGGVQELVRLDGASLFSSEIGVVGIDPKLVGRTLLRDVASAPGEVLTQCK